MIRIIDMTEALSQTEFAFGIFDTVRSRFMIDRESGFQTWTLSEWEDRVFCTFDEEFKQRVRNLLPKYPIVVINGEPYDTEIINAVQRFVPNRIVRDILDVSSGQFPGANWQGHLDLNGIAIGVARDKYSEDENRQLYRLIGYSIGGYEEIFSDDDIDNPLWDTGPEPREFVV